MPHINSVGYFVTPYGHIVLPDHGRVDHPFSSYSWEKHKQRSLCALSLQLDEHELCDNHPYEQCPKRRWDWPVRPQNVPPVISLGRVTGGSQGERSERIPKRTYPPSRPKGVGAGGASIDRCPLFYKKYRGHNRYLEIAVHSILISLLLLQGPGHQVYFKN